MKVQADEFYEINLKMPSATKSYWISNRDLRTGASAGLPRSTHALLKTQAEVCAKCVFYMILVS